MQEQPSLAAFLRTWNTCRGMINPEQAVYRQHQASAGFTLIEFLLGGLVLAIAITAILGAYIGQVTLNEHARNLSLAIQDANRVIEQMRQDTSSGCTSPPTLVAPAPGGAGAGLTNGWNAWINASKSLQPDPTNNELVVVTCQASAGGNALDCDTPLTDPVRVTVAVCWRHRNRIIGECTALGAALQPNPGAAGGADAQVTESPAMLTTLVTCRG